MTGLDRITKPDISALNTGDEILIRASVVHGVKEGENFCGIVVKSMASNENIKGTCFFVDRGCYFGKIEPDISVGDKFKSIGNECTVIAIHKDNVWVEWLGGFCDTRTISFLRTLEKLPK